MLRKDSSSSRAWALEFSDTISKKIEECRLLHERQRKKLDSDLESNPLESSFSSQLMDLMQREEQAANQGLLEAQEQISKRVDSALKNETFRHFKMQAQQNQRRWAALLERQANEREKIAQELHEGYCRLCLLLSKPAPAQYVPISELAHQRNALSAGRQKVNLKKLKNPDGSLNMDAFWEEEMKMRLDTYRAWPDHERANLDMAFGLQVQRVDAEWGTYEQQMRRDYEQQRSELEGVDPGGGGGAADAAGLGGAGGGASHHISKEKQARLIHTAPVFEPSAAGGGGGGGRRASPAARQRRGQRPGAAADEAARRELRQLEAAFEEAKARIHFQKRSALRWIQRQSSRMSIQIQTMEAYRKMVADHAERELGEVGAMRARRAEAARLAAALQTYQPGAPAPAPGTENEPPAANAAGAARGGGGGGGDPPFRKTHTGVPRLPASGGHRGSIGGGGGGDRRPATAAPELQAGGRPPLSGGCYPDRSSSRPGSSEGSRAGGFLAPIGSAAGTPSKGANQGRKPEAWQNVR